MLIYKPHSAWFHGYRFHAICYRAACGCKTVKHICSACFLDKTVEWSTHISSFLYGIFNFRLGVPMPRSPTRPWSVNFSRSPTLVWQSFSSAVMMPGSCWQQPPDLTPLSYGWPAMAGVLRKALSRGMRSPLKELSHSNWSPTPYQNSTATSSVWTLSETIGILGIKNSGSRGSSVPWVEVQDTERRHTCHRVTRTCQLTKIILSQSPRSCSWLTRCMPWLMLFTICSGVYVSTPASCVTAWSPWMVANSTGITSLMSASQVRE